MLKVKDKGGKRKEERGIPGFQFSVFSQGKEAHGFTIKALSAIFVAIPALAGIQSAWRSWSRDLERMPR